jgi:urease accessory protein
MPRDPDATIHQRADGLLRLRIGTTGLAQLYHRAPLRALFPAGESGAALEVAQANVAGGLAGGDAIETQATLEAGARAVLTGAAAEKIYRSLGDATRVTTRLDLRAGAALEWLPQETILFDGARLTRRMEVTLAPGAMLLAAEMLVFGRLARGEAFREGALFDAWRVRTEAGLLWADALRLDEPARQIGRGFGLAGAEAAALLLLASPEAARHRDLARDLAQGAASLPRPGLLLLRWLGPAVAVRAGLRQAVVALRHAALGEAAVLPRLWTC